MDGHAPWTRRRRVITMVAGLAAVTMAFIVSRSGPFDLWRPGTTHTGTVSAAGCSIFYPDDTDRTVTTSDPSTLGWSSVERPPDSWTTVKRVKGELTVVDEHQRGVPCHRWDARVPPGVLPGE